MKTAADSAREQHRTSPDVFARLSRMVQVRQMHWILFSIVLLLGAFSRLWEFRTLPPGLAADEASIGVEAYDLLHYGLDRNGVSFPVHFISFGSGQNALYGYVLIPFVALFGLSPSVVRLPMLISGLLSMPLVYWTARRTFGAEIGLRTMFFLAISPWHILLSRFGLESNFFVFLFLAAYACLLLAVDDNRWLLAAAPVFALSLFNYGPAYLIVPIFLANALWILRRERLLSAGYLISGAAVFIAISLPIALYIAVNIWRLPSVHVGAITIPSLPGQARFLSETGGLRSNLLPTLLSNAWTLTSLLFRQTDGLLYNAFEPYGYFYKITFPLALGGVYLLVKKQLSAPDFNIGIFLAWLAACGLFGILQPVNINRINVLFPALLVSTALAFHWLGQRSRFFLPAAVTCLLVAFAIFTADYHGSAYREAADFKLHAGFLSAIRYASEASDGPICVTDRVDMPYIYVLFSEGPDPRSYAQEVQYAPSGAATRNVRSLLRYTFGKENCGTDPGLVYVLRFDDGRLQTGVKYSTKRFGNFAVYTPRP